MPPTPPHSLASPPAPPASDPPALWYEPAPRHFDNRIPCWFKAAIIVALTILSMFYLDRRIALYCHDHAVIPDLARAGQNVDDSAARYKGGDAGRELMFLEQFGQGSCTVAIIAAVALIDPKGRRRALAIGAACLLTFLVTHFLKDLCGRSRPFIPGPNQTNGRWIFAGPHMGFTGGAAWASFPSAHTTAAFALACSLSWFYPRARGLFITLALITAAQRVLHTAHYLSDVIAGMGIGTLVSRLTLSQKIPGRLLALLPSPLRAWFLTDRH